MSTLMEGLAPAADDPLLGLMAAARADDRPGKVDLGVGIYRDSRGETPVMQAVKAAEETLLANETTKAYEGPQGNLHYVELLTRLILGETSDRHVAFATPGGSGALFIGMEMVRELNPSARIFTSNPSWPNHQGIARSLGIECLFFDYVTTADGTPDLDKVMAGLEDVRRGDVLLLQGPCHNPSGTDFSAGQWSEIAAFARDKGALLFVDIAYQGFGEGLDTDIGPIRKVLSNVPEAILTYSCSKNFGIYRERTGLLLLQAPSAKAADAARSRAAAAVRSCYSMPPAHGPALVATILGTPQLYAEWTAELDTMRARLNNLRAHFSAALVDATGSASLAVLGKEKGMFSLLPISAENIMTLRREHAIYMPASGRINVAGLQEDRLAEVAAQMAPYLNPEG